MFLSIYLGIAKRLRKWKHAPFVLPLTDLARLGCWPLRVVGPPALSWRPISMPLGFSLGKRSTFPNLPSLSNGSQHVDG
jgi:hypothetical protein